MKYDLRFMNKAKNGFTLIELLVVVAIISILTLVTVSQFQTARKKANDVARKGDLSALAKALEMYYADYGKFPISDNGLIKVTDNNGGKDIPWGGEFSDNSNPSYVYMKTTPQEKILAATFPYCYVADAGGTKFGIFAMLENTTDSQCSTTVVAGNTVGSYVHCGGKTYCFAYVSPNIVATDLGNTIP